MTAGDPTAILDTLETIIAPGRRARLSPFVEAAQFQVLFGRIPDMRRWAQSCQEILAERASQAQIARLARCWKQFAAAGKDFAVNNYQDPDFLNAYLASYFSVNVPKVQWLLFDLVRQGRLTGVIDLLDIGVGTGTTAVALLDFLLAWGHVCDLHGQPFPVSDVRLTGIDRSPGSLRHARQVVEAYAEALHRRLEVRSGADRQAPSHDLLARVHDWATRAVWREHDLAVGVPDLAIAPNLVIAANIHNELSLREKENLDLFLNLLPAGAVVGVIEPGSPNEARALMSWRRQFLAGRQRWRSLGPCGQEFGQNLPAACHQCWNARREGFHQTSLYRAFWLEASNPLSQTTAGTGGGDRFDDYKNRLLSWSYVLVGAGTHGATINEHPGWQLSSGQFIRTPVILRYVGTQYERDESTILVSGGPDEFRVDASHTPSTEYLKVCPGIAGVSRLAVQRGPGIQVPPLRFGQQFSIANVEVVQKDRSHDVWVIRARRGEPPQISSADERNRRGQFLHRDDERTRAAVDELAYRLFGFERLYSYQHNIVGRVLTGRSVLGIAATGSGKSECFILPAMLLSGITIVISPLKSLMADQYDQRLTNRYGLNFLSTYINGDIQYREREARLRRMELGYYKLVYVTPEQLERGWVLASLRRAHQTIGVRYLAVDEAHCISQWGHDFRPSYLNILRRLREYGMDPVRIALTATASREVRRDICDELDLDPRVLGYGSGI